jgi:hypothetical protein
VQIRQRDWRSGGHGRLADLPRIVAGDAGPTITRCTDTMMLD